LLAALLREELHATLRLGIRIDERLLATLLRVELDAALPDGIGIGRGRRGASMTRLCRR